MNRRELLKLIAMGIVGHTLDLDKLLWIPNQKKIFIPSSHGLTISQVIELEMKYIGEKIEMLFERDNTFYDMISNGKTR